MRTSAAQRQQSVTYASIGALYQRPDPLTGQHLYVLVARQRRGVLDRHDRWLGGVVRLATVGQPAEVYVLRDGRKVVVGALLEERTLDSFQAELMLEAVLREAEIEAEVERMCADPEMAVLLFREAADYVPDLD